MLDRARDAVRAANDRRERARFLRRMAEIEHENDRIMHDPGSFEIHGADLDPGSSDDHVSHETLRASTQEIEIVLDEREQLTHYLEPFRKRSAARNRKPFGFAETDSVSEWGDDHDLCPVAF